MAREDYQPYPTQVPSGPASDTYQHVNTPVAAFGGPIAQGLSEAGNKGVEAALAFQGLQNETHAKEADIGFSSAINKVMSDPQNGYLTKFGKDAATGYGAVDQQLQALYKQYRASLPDAEAQKMFDSVAVRRVQGAQEQASNHAATENKKWIIGTGEARIQNEIDSSALNWGDEKAFNTNLGTIAEEAKDRSSILGEGDEQTALAIRHYQSEAIEARVTAAMKTNPMVAQDILDRYGDKMDAAHLARATAQLQPLVMGQQARSSADMIVSGLDNHFQNQPQDIGAVSERITSVVPGARITSGPRTPEENAAVGGVPDSAHLKGRAIDFVPPHGMTLDEAANEVRRSNPALKVIVEGPGAAHSTAPHVHVEWKGAPTANPDTGKQFQSQADYYRQHYAEILDHTDALADKQQPGNFAYRDQLHSRVEQKLNDAIRQQELSYKVDNDMVYQAMNGSLTGGHIPTSVDELRAIPKVGDAWDRMQANNPYGAQAIENKLMTANSSGHAASYGADFYNKLQAVLSAPSDPHYVHDPNKLAQDVTPGNNGPLTNTGFSQLNTFLGMRGTPEGESFVAQTKDFLNTTHSIISGADSKTGVIDHVGEQKFNQYLQTVIPAIIAGKKANKTAAQLFDPKSPDYVGASALNFTRPVAQRVKDMTDDKMVSAMYGPKPMSPMTVSMIDNAVKAKQLTADQGSAIKGIMQRYNDKKITAQQAKAQIVTIVPSLAPPPPVPGAHE